jgi:hypothetical protein
MGEVYEVHCGMASGGTIYKYIPSFMMIGSGIHVILRLLPQFKRLQHS